MVVTPDMGSGVGLTVKEVTDVHPVAESVYVMVIVPASAPVTTPVVEPTVAMVVLLLPHVPPPVPSDSVDDSPWHTCTAPDMAAGSGLTNTVPVIKHPVDKV